MSNKKWLFCSIIGLMLLASISACGNGNQPEQAEGKVNVVTSFYPLYYFAKEIGGDQAHVENLISAGVEPHDWTPKSRDLDAVSKAQLFLYNGAGLEGWVDDFLHGLGSNSKVVTVETSKGIQLIEGNPEEEHVDEEHVDEEHVEEEHVDEEHVDEEHVEEEHVDEEDHGHSELDVDPHTWVSPRSALIMADNIRDAFVAADVEHKADYDSRFMDLETRLKQLDEKFTTGLADYERRDIVVSHQAFGYLCRDYNLNQIAIMGLSPEAEPRSQDLLKIADYVKKNNIPYIFFEELVSERLANTLASEANVDTLVLNPLEGLTSEQEKSGETYITLMERNLVNLQKALE